MQFLFLSKITSCVGVFIFAQAVLADFAGADELNIYVIQPAKEIDWTTPSTLVKSTFDNMINRNDRAIGHMFTEVKCLQKNKSIKHHIISGMTSDNDDESIDHIFVKGYGLGAMITVMKGHLEDHDFLQEQIERFAGEDKKSKELGWNKPYSRMNFLNFKISSTTCNRLIHFYEEYRRRGLDKYYGGPATSALDGKGAGCSAYGMAFLEVAGINIKPLEKTWMTQVLGPLKYFGEPWSGHRVNVSKFLFPKSGMRWATSNEDHILIQMWDPTRMAKWILNVWQGKERAGQLKPVAYGKTLGLAADATQLPTPTDPIFKD